MADKTPKDIAKAGIATDATKAKLSWDKALVAGFPAGAYHAREIHEQPGDTPSEAEKLERREPVGAR